MNTKVMLGNSKWAPGGQHDQAEANAPAPPMTVPTGPRDTQRRRHRGSRSGGNEVSGERTGSRNSNNGATKSTILKEDAATDLNTTAETQVIKAAANPDIEARIRKLEDTQQNPRDDIDALEQLYIGLSNSVKNLRYFKNTPVNPATPLARPPAPHLANNTSFHIPVQGNLTDDNFLFLLKTLASRRISAEEWDDAVKQIESWDSSPSATPTSQNEVIATDAEAGDSAGMDRMGTIDVNETRTDTARFIEEEGNGWRRA